MYRYKVKRSALECKTWTDGWAALNFPWMSCLSFTLYICLLFSLNFFMTFESDKNELFHIIPVPHLFILKSSFSKNNLSAAHLPCLHPQETCQQSFPSVWWFSFKPLDQLDLAVCSHRGKASGCQGLVSFAHHCDLCFLKADYSHITIQMICKLYLVTVFELKTNFYTGS